MKSLKTLWNEYHQLSQDRVVAVNEGLDTAEIDQRWDEVCAEIEALSEKQD